MARQNSPPMVHEYSQEERILFERYLQEEHDGISLFLPSKDRSPKKSPIDDIFSPRNFDEYIGQSEAKELSRIMVKAAHNEDRHLPNILVVGEYGLGKTSLARVIIREAKVDERLYDGTSINKEFPESGTIIIDEIHNLDPQIQDTLNVKLDNGTYNIIGCTNHPGKLSGAFRSRFRTLQLTPYTPDDLKLILRKVCERKGVKFSPQSLELLALRSRFNARQAIMYLSMVFDIMSVNRMQGVTIEVVNSTFEKMGVDSRGLLPRDREYLRILPTDRPVGLQYLAAVLGTDEKTIEEEVEPFLLRMGLVDRTQRGRVKIAS